MAYDGRDGRQSTRKVVHMRSKRIVSVLLGAALAFGMVPPAALAEAALEAQAIDQGARAADGNVEESATQRLEKALAEAEGALEARTRIAGAEWPQEWPEPDLVEVDGAPGPGSAVAEESTDVASINATTDESAETAKTDVVADAQVLVGKEQADDETVREFVDLQIRVAKDMRGDHDVWYRVHTQDGWLAWVSNGASAGEYDGKRNDAIVDDVEVAYVTKEQSQRFVEADYDLAALEGGVDSESQAAASDPTNAGLESVETKAPAAALQAADEKAVAVAQATVAPAISYRVHAQTYGWMDTVTNGAMAGTEGEAKRLEAIQIMLVAKGGQAPAEAGSVDGADPSVKSGVSYRANVEGFGWMGWVQDGDTAGSTGISAKLLAFSASLVGIDDSELHYAAHVQSYGWEEEASGGEIVGRPNEGKRLEAIRMRLSGTAAQNFDIYYRCHIQSFGWLNWASNNADAGSTLLGKRIEAIQVVLVPKGGTPPAVYTNRDTAAMSAPTLRYRGHVQGYGWMNWVGDGELAGTTGESKRVEALQADLGDSGLTGEIRMNAHVQSYGWLGWVGEGELAGTMGEGKRVEAFQMSLTGEIASMYDVWYRVHVQRIGWMGWASNGQSAGTQYLSLRVEAVQIKLVPKGVDAPGSTEQTFLDGRYISKMGYQNPPGYYQVSSQNVTITSAAQYPWNYVTPSRIGVWASRGECVETFVQRAAEYVGTPYMWNYSCAPGIGVDCIGLVYQCAYACGMDLGGGTGDSDFNPWAHYITGNSGWHSHDAENFWNYGDAIHVPLSSRQRGDVISWPGHVAVYLGNDEIIEAYQGMGVVYNSLWAHGTPRGCIRLFQ